MRIDAHQQFWHYSAEEHGWIDDSMSILRRDFLPEHLEPELKQAGFDACIAVQARQTLEETRWLLNLAASSPLVRGVVGWVDLQSEGVREQLLEFASNPKIPRRAAHRSERTRRPLSAPPRILARHCGFSRPFHYRPRDPDRQPEEQRESARPSRALLPPRAQFPS